MEKQKGESLGVVIVESGWGSILPTVILASVMNSGPAARSGKLSVGDQIMSINDTSLVGLPLATCQGIIKVLSVSGSSSSPVQILCVRPVLLKGRNGIVTIENSSVFICVWSLATQIVKVGKTDT